MRLQRIVMPILLLGSAALSQDTAWGQNYPSKPIRIVTTGSGDGTDFVARSIAQGITTPLGKQVIVDNHSGVVTGDIVAKAPPDGYTLLVIGQAHWIGPLMQQVPYDVIKDFCPITIAERSPAIIVVNPSLPVKSVAELVALAKAKPGELNYGSIQAGSAGHLAGELFKSVAGVNIVWVAYKTMGSAVTDLVSSRIQVSFTSPSSVMSQVNAGRLRALAVATAHPSPLVPGLPTAAASGLPGYEAESMTAVFAPARTPQAIVDRLNREMVRNANTEEMKAQLFKLGSESVASSPEELAAAVKSDMAKYGKVIKEAGIKLD